MARSEQNRWRTLDKDLDRIGTLEIAARQVTRWLVSLGLAGLFLVVVALAGATHAGVGTNGVLLGVAALVSGYLALAIGASDVANNMGPVVGARALSMGGALVIAALAESAGALLAGWDVVDTISAGILAPETLREDRVLVLAMIAALLSAALWMNIATWTGLAVSTTHSVVGGVMGAGIAAHGLGAVNWPQMAGIGTSWIFAPVFGGVVAAGLLAFLKPRVIEVEDRIGAACRWVPILIGVMLGCFCTYLAAKGLRFGLGLPPLGVLALGVLGGGLAWGISVPMVRRAAIGLENRRRSLKVLFRLPLILAGTLLSFGHGANDVSNAVGPLVAVVAVLAEPGAGAGVNAEVPLWVMLIGSMGISFGLLLFGPRLIRLVGSEITKLNPTRGFCVALGTAITVILASWLGLPVSSTHIAVGAVFGVGFYREWYTRARPRRREADAEGRGKLAPPEVRTRRMLVRRSHVVSMMLAWMVTVPLTGLVAGGIYLALEFLSG